MVSTAGLTVIVLVHGAMDGQSFSGDHLLRLVPMMFGLSVVLWGLATAVSVMRNRRP